MNKHGFAIRDIDTSFIMKIEEKPVNMPPKTSRRLQFIDLTRGLIMAIMAWDHVTGFWNRFHHGGEGRPGSSNGY